MFRTMSAAAAAMVLAGCASLAPEASQDLRIDIRTASGRMVPGASCLASNEHGTYRLESGSVHPVRRATGDLKIACHHAGLPPAFGVASARAASDGSIFSSSRYSYPAWIELVFGQELAFDRGHEAKGTMISGRPLRR
jgi:hypothetical protein